MKNIHNILEKLYTKWGVETIPRPFSKKSKLGVFLDQWSKVFTVCFDCMASCGLLKCIETKLLTTFFYLSYKPFLKNKEGSRNSLPALFAA